MRSCTYCGRSNEVEALRCFECGTELPLAPTPPIPVTPPPLPDPRLVDPEEISAAFSFANAFHRPDWDFIHRWISTRVEPWDTEEAWNEAALIWVRKLRDDLGSDYVVLQSRQTILLCALPIGTANWLLDYAGRAMLTIKEQLGDVAPAGRCGKGVVLVFTEEDDYYQYLSHHTHEGVQAASGGVCIHSGYTHIAVPWREELDAANAIIHELTHDSLSHLPLPLWLNEGVAVTLQKAVAPPPRALAQGDQDALFAAAINWKAPMIWDELAERHFSFWTEENIQSFWAGTSYYQPGDPSELSYSLAEVLVKLITEQNNHEAFLAFLRSARSDDAGQTAALEILGLDLGELAGTFLGQGNWRPSRKAMVECWEASGWTKVES